ncbi:MAG: 6-carboxytetrahydropterin synthase QueD [Salibacteraceae bacterium]|jgi:6-pyruvoyltetrahydropterin/6-carboxytetrahydropterin synthase|nr:6-carboxytetrahydropterin synthase QueD [Salibacteraceae bacterium]|tara:strand:+ start:51633 stop:51986 length:354 start_codon:yes stop_codon:yes gene_type:complete
MLIYKQFTFDSAHQLPNVPEGHKCKNLHGHTYHLTVYLEGDLDEKLGWVMDFSEVKAAMKPVLNQMDHNYLNDIKGLENPTSEVLVVWIWNQIKPALSMLKKLELKETPTSGAIYEG